MIFLGIIVAFIVFSVVILVHEWGHFASARKFGVKVEEFGLGLPPRAKTLFRDKKGTIFSLNWLPIGGFVKLYGENPSSVEKQDKKKALYFKPAWQQSIIILAGVFMNFLLACVIFSILFFIGVKPIGINTIIETGIDSKIIPSYSGAIRDGLLVEKPGIILEPIDGSIAFKAGIKKGDVLLEITNSYSNPNFSPHPNPFPKGEGIKGINQKENIDVKTAINIIKNNPGKKLIFTIKREDKIIEIPIIPLPLGEVRGGQIIESGKDEGGLVGGGQGEKKIEIRGEQKNPGKIGAYIGKNIELNESFEYKYGIFDSIKYGVVETYSHIILTLKGLKMLAEKIFTPETPKERQEALNQMSGPIGIVDFISNSLSGGFVFIIIIGAIISINLGVFNLLPIPALDGGRFLFITLNSSVEKIFGKKLLKEQSEAIIHFLFFILLIALSLIIGYNDIIKIIEK